MDKQQLYMALLTLYENNFRGLHWKLSGHGFDKNHTRFGDYYEQLGTYMDETAELMITQGMAPIGMTHVTEILQDADESAIIIDMSMDYDGQTADTAAYNMFELLHKVAVELEDEDDLDSDVRDFYMDHARYYRLEGMYKLRRALSINANPNTVKEPEVDEEPEGDSEEEDDD